MFSATWPREVRQLADEFQHAPVRIHVGSTDKLVASENITQHVTVVASPQEKLERLIELVLEQQNAAATAAAAAAAEAAEPGHGADGEADGAASMGKTVRGRRAAAPPPPRGRARSNPCHTVVFVNRKKEIDSIARKLSKAAGGAGGGDRGGDRFDRGDRYGDRDRDRSEPSMRVVALHGDMQQPARDRNLELVKSGRAQARTHRTPHSAHRTPHTAYRIEHGTAHGTAHGPHMAPRAHVHAHPAHPALRLCRCFCALPPATDEEPSHK